MNLSFTCNFTFNTRKQFINVIRKCFQVFYWFNRKFLYSQFFKNNIAKKYFFSHFLVIILLKVDCIFSKNAKNPSLKFWILHFLFPSFSYIWVFMSTLFVFYFIFFLIFYVFAYYQMTFSGFAPFISLFSGK